MLRQLKVLLRSRRLFRNWLVLGVKYYLMRHGIIKAGDLAVRCRGGGKITIEPWSYGLIVGAYYDGLIVGVNCDGYLMLPNHALLSIKRVNEVIGVRYGWLFDGNYWFRENVKFKYIHWPVIETFNLGQYDFLNVEGRVVVDIGAFVGDTPIYFVLRGAKRVYAIEPLPENFSEMLENLRLNGIDRVVPINAVINYEGGEILIPRSTALDLRGSSINKMFKSSSSNFVQIKAYRLSDLVHGYNMETDILKMDCEGCEYDIILKDYETVRRFNELVFEYHAYETKTPIDQLINKLNKDFVCKSVKVEFYSKYFPGYSRDLLGMIHCVKH